MIEGVKMAKAKPIFIPGTNQTFKSTAAAAKALGIDAGNITKVLRGKRKTAGGYSFGYVSNRTIYIPETGQTFSSVKAAAKSVKVSPKKVEHIIENNVGKTVGGYHFEYADASKITPASDNRPSAAPKKNRKAKKQTRQKQHRQKKQAKFERQQQKEEQRRQERKKIHKDKPWYDKVLSPEEAAYVKARQELKDYLQKVNDKIAEYKARHKYYIYYNQSAPGVLGLQLIIGGTENEYFDTSLSKFGPSDPSAEALQEATEQLKRLKERIEAETNKANGRFWNISIASGNRQAFALEFNITTTQMDEYAYLLWDMFYIFAKSNQAEELGSDKVYNAVRDAMQGGIPAYKLSEFLENIDAYMNGSKIQELEDIFAILDGYEPPDDSVWNDEGWVL